VTDPVLEALREIAPAARGQVAVGEDGGRMLRWVESGTGTPTVVLIAGRNDTALSWDRCWPHRRAGPTPWPMTAPGWATVTPTRKSFGRTGRG